MRAVICGTGRCGSTWIHDVLNAADVECGHEEQFTPALYRDSWLTQEKGGNVRNMRVDSSMYALPYLEGRADPEMPPWEGWILHQIREPLACIGSIFGWKLLDRHAQGQGARFVTKHFELNGDTMLANVCRFYVVWNRRIEALGPRYLRYRVEDVDAKLVTDIAHLVGEPITTATAGKAIRSTENRYYGGGVRGDDFKAVPLTWEDIPSGVRPQVERAADRYGYR